MRSPHSERMKAALIRAPGYPVGQPAPMHLNCECGEQCPVPSIGLKVRCRCGIEYDAGGWITHRPDTTSLTGGATP